MKKRYGVVLAGMILCQANTASAASEQLYDQGRNYTSQLGGTEMTYSTVVMSAQAMYYNTQGWGRERIRLWSKLDQVNMMYPPSVGYINTVEQMNLRFMANDANASALVLTGSDPVTTKTSYTVPPIIYDILNYAQIETNTIQAYVNDMTTTGTEVIQNTGYDWGIVFYRPEHRVVDLPNTIKFSDADKQVQGRYSGADAKFNYNLPSNMTNFYVWPQGQVKYRTYYSLSTTTSWHVWSSAVGIQHRINKTY